MDEKKESKSNSSIGELSSYAIDPTESFESNYYRPNAIEEKIQDEGLSKKEREKILSERNSARDKKMESSRKDSIKEGCATSVMSGF